MVNVPMFTCESCDDVFAYETDQACSISIYGECLACSLDRRPDILNQVESIKDLIKLDWYKPLIQEREKREKKTGRRVFDCPNCYGGRLHMEPACSMCSGRGWVRGYPPN